MAFDSQPKFSPDGKWIAFISDREGSENIWVMHPDGSGVKQVSKDPNSEFVSPSWSPDGNYIFVSKGRIWNRVERNLDVSHRRRIRRANHKVQTDTYHEKERIGRTQWAWWRRRTENIFIMRRSLDRFELQRTISAVAYRAARPEDGRRRRHHQRSLKARFGRYCRRMGRKSCM